MRIEVITNSKNSHITKSKFRVNLALNQGVIMKKNMLVMLFLVLSNLAGAWVCHDDKGSSLSVDRNYLQPDLGFDALIILEGTVIDSMFHDYMSLVERYIDEATGVSRFQYDNRTKQLLIMSRGYEGYNSQVSVMGQDSVEVSPYKEGVKLYRYFGGSDLLPEEYWYFKSCTL